MLSQKGKFCISTYSLILLQLSLREKTVQFALMVCNCSHVHVHIVIKVIFCVLYRKSAYSPTVISNHFCLIWCFLLFFFFEKNLLQLSFQRKAVQFVLKLRNYSHAHVYIVIQVIFCVLYRKSTGIFLCYDFEPFFMN